MRYQNGKASLLDLKLYGSEFMKVQDDNLPLITNVPVPSTPTPKFVKSLDISFSVLKSGPP